MTTHPSLCDCDHCLLRQMQATAAIDRQRGWEAWYHRDAAHLSSYLRRRCRVARCPDAAEDLLHECFVVGFRAIVDGRYVDRGLPLVRFLYGIAKNLLREVQRDQCREVVGADDIEWEPVDHLGVDDLILIRELCRLVREAHHRQSPLHQQVVHALYREGKSSEKLAVEIGKTAGNTRIIAHRAVAEIVEYLNRQHRVRLSSRAIRAVFETF